MPWLWPLIAAPFIGSFLGVVVLRLGTDAPIVFGRSACRACKAALSPADLVPLLSWALAGGRCRHCGSGVGTFYPAMELAALGVASWVAAVPDIGGSPSIWVNCLLGWMLLAIAASELRRGLMPDSLALLLLAAGLAESIALAPDTLHARIAGAVAGYALAAAIRIARRALCERPTEGADCAILLAAAGAWVSWTGLPAVMLLTTAAALGVLAVRTASGRMPFATSLCIGTWIVWLHGGTLR